MGATIAAMIDYALEAATIVLVIHILLSWLIGYRMIGHNNSWVKAIHVRLAKVVAPVLWPIRLLLPNTGAIDLSPVFLIVLILTARYAIQLYPLA
jgi:YggT family protein